MDPRHFGCRIIKRFSKQFPKLIFRLTYFNNKYVTYFIEKDKKHFGYLCIFGSYKITFYPSLPHTKRTSVKTIKDRIKISQAIHEQCVEFDLYKN